MTGFLAKSEPIRRYLYGLLTPALTLLVVYGVLDDSAVALWTALGAAVLVPVGVETARTHTTPLVGRGQQVQADAPLEPVDDDGDEFGTYGGYTSGHK